MADHGLRALPVSDIDLGDAITRIENSNFPCDPLSGAKSCAVIYDRNTRELRVYGQMLGQLPGGNYKWAIKEYISSPIDQYINFPQGQTTVGPLTWRLGTNFGDLDQKSSIAALSWVPAADNKLRIRLYVQSNGILNEYRYDGQNWDPTARPLSGGTSPNSSLAAVGCNNFQFLSVFHRDAANHLCQEFSVDGGNNWKSALTTGGNLVAQNHPSAAPEDQGEIAAVAWPTDKADFYIRVFYQHNRQLTMHNWDLDRWYETNPLPISVDFGYPMSAVHTNVGTPHNVDKIVLFYRQPQVQNVDKGNLAFVEWDGITKAWRGKTMSDLSLSFSSGKYYCPVLSAAEVAAGKLAVYSVSGDEVQSLRITPPPGTPGSPVPATAAGSIRLATMPLYVT